MINYKQLMSTHSFKRKELDQRHRLEKIKIVEEQSIALNLLSAQHQQEKACLLLDLGREKSEWRLESRNKCITFAQTKLGDNKNNNDQQESLQAWPHLQSQKHIDRDRICVDPYRIKVPVRSVKVAKEQHSNNLNKNKSQLNNEKNNLSLTCSYSSGYTPLVISNSNVYSQPKSSQQQQHLEKSTSLAEQKECSEFLALNQNYSNGTVQSSASLNGQQDNQNWNNNQHLQETVRKPLEQLDNLPMRSKQDHELHSYNNDNNDHFHDESTADLEKRSQPGNNFESMHRKEDYLNESFIARELEECFGLLSDDINIPSKNNDQQSYEYTSNSLKNNFTNQQTQVCTFNENGCETALNENDDDELVRSIVKSVVDQFD